MIPGLGPATSGLQAAQTRLQTSAANVANTRSVGAEDADGPARTEQGRNAFRPQRVVQQASETGGVRTDTAPVRPTSVQQFQPDAPSANDQGLVNRPNVSFVQETVTQIEARAQFSANLTTIDRATEMRDSLLDIEL
ncbi:flagellar basal-body rod protein FlgC [Limimonas halophila]|uniref:Flagellar basal-body rod protein FlgC n=1 Tax=Limimonas halophila TaxID=1082479 RepID=A0A1G7SS38_9PROT|nr:flagellar basal body rod C-terminal domain-containing protein [Limimonas halophila]SDG25239.1 flagellar basal-body rod protein FlgC [Limimonas halophila]